MREQKFIIVKVNGKLRHFVGVNGQDHLVIAKNKHLSEEAIIEKGFLIDKTLEIWECYDKEHLHKIKAKTPDKWLGHDLEDYEATLKREWWRK